VRVRLKMLFERMIRVDLYSVSYITQEASAYFTKAQAARIRNHMSEATKGVPDQIRPEH
jgi:hypothetical protein